MLPDREVVTSFKVIRLVFVCLLVCLFFHLKFAGEVFEALQTLPIPFTNCNFFWFCSMIKEYFLFKQQLKTNFEILG